MRIPLYLLAQYEAEKQRLAQREVQVPLYAEVYDPREVRPIFEPGEAHPILEPEVAAGYEL